MNTVKMSLATIQGKFSRAEMKNIMAGSGGGICIAAFIPLSADDCFPYAVMTQLYVGTNGWWCCNCQESINLCS